MEICPKDLPSSHPQETGDFRGLEKEMLQDIPVWVSGYCYGPGVLCSAHSDTQEEEKTRVDQSIPRVRGGRATSFHQWNKPTPSMPAQSPRLCLDWKLAIDFSSPNLTNHSSHITTLAIDNTAPKPHTFSQTTYNYLVTFKWQHWLFYFFW